METSETAAKSAAGARGSAAKARAAAAKEAAQRFKQAQRAAALMKHVSDPTRLQIVMTLAEGEVHVGALCEQLSQSQPAVSHHLSLLRHGGVISPRRQGKNNFYELTEAGVDLARLVKPLLR